MHHEVAAAIVPSLANDQMMAGALDSACNRTCSGNVWLQHYLAALKHAPKCLRDLHATVQEDELFRFGNGGTQRSQVRHRLPMVVGDYLVLTWVSVVEVPSLGLLLGRDFLDSIGAVISFSKRQMRADHLDGKIINLKQLTAGHFALQLIPQEWPQPLQKRWRRLGKCGILELQLTAQEWLQRKLAAVSVSALSSKISSHEHLITEQGVQAADVKFSGLPIFATAAQNISSSDSLANGQRSLDSAVVSATTTSSLHTPSPLDGPSKLSNMGRKVAKIRAANAMPRRMASAWVAFVAIAVAANSICPTSISTCERCPWMGESGGRDDGQQITGKEAWCQSHEGQGAEQCKFATLRQSSESHGPGACFPGRSSSTRYLGRQNNKGHGSSNSSSSVGGFEARGQEEQSRRQTTRSCPSVDRTARWTSSAEGRFGEAGLPGQRRSRPGRHSGEVASQGEAVGRRHCSEASTKVSSSKGKSLAKQCTACADPSSEVLTVGTLEQSGACGKDGHGRSSSVDARTRSSFSGHDDSSHAVFHRHAGWNWQHDRSAPVREPSDATRSTATRRTSRCSDGTTDAHGGGTLEINGLHQRELEEENFIAIHGSLPGDDLDLVRPNMNDP